MNTKGIWSNRIATNPREAAFAKKWEDENQDGHTILPHLLGIDKDRYRDTVQNGLDRVNERDATVAATIVQWLGSNVGMAFICEVANSCPEVRRFMQSGINFEDKK